MYAHEKVLERSLLCKICLKLIVKKLCEIQCFKSLSSDQVHLTSVYYNKGLTGGGIIISLLITGLDSRTFNLES